MADETVWKKRFAIFTLVRLTGLATLVLGLVIAKTDLIRDGGWPMVGLVVAAMGGLDMLLAPRLLKKLWQEQDSAADRPGDGPAR